MNSSRPQERTFAHQDQVDTVSDYPVLLDFNGGRLTSDAGLLLLKKIDEQLGLSTALASVLRDERRADRIQFTMQDLLRQRVFQIAAGYEDQDDSDHLRDDPIFKLLLNRLPETGAALASQPTMSRFENGVSRQELYRMAEVFLAQFINSYAEPPEVIVLDFDDTEDLVHGNQEQARFNGYVGNYCFFPLHIYEGLSGRLIATVLKPRMCKGLQIKNLLRRLVERLRQAWPETVIIFRGDSHFSRFTAVTGGQVLAYCDQSADLHYVTGLQTNAVLKRLAQPIVARAETRFAKGYLAKVVCFHSVRYQAGTWTHPRRVIIKVECTAKGTNVRFIVTDLEQAGAKTLYQRVYCARGQMENYIKDHKRGLKSDRTSCHRFVANQFRLLLHSAAYVLLWALREQVLPRGPWSRVRFQTLQLRLLKLGACVKEHAHRVQVSLPASCPVAGLVRTSFELLNVLPAP